MYRICRNYRYHQNLLRLIRRKIFDCSLLYRLGKTTSTTKNLVIRFNFPSINLSSSTIYLRQVGRGGIENYGRSSIISYFGLTKFYQDKIVIRLRTHFPAVPSTIDKRCQHEKWSRKIIDLFSTFKLFALMWRRKLYCLTNVSFRWDHFLQTNTLILLLVR